MPRFLSFLFLLFLLAACREAAEERELVATLEQAGENRFELEAVLEHYRQEPDARKLTAAKFLIRNMQYYDNYYSPEIERYYERLDSVNRLTPTRWKMNRMQDSLMSRLRQPMSIGQKRFDSQMVTADFLIRHIDSAFVLLDHSLWCRNVSFEDFCEYLLPYRVADERINIEWLPFYRERVQERIRRLRLDTLPPVEQLYITLRRARTNHHIDVRYRNLYNHGYDPTHLYYMKWGTCLNYSVLSCHLFRSVGIPMTVDFVPVWANRSMGHDWNVLLIDSSLADTVANLDYCFSAHAELLGHHVSNRKERVSKVYRKTFSPQRDALGWVHGDEPVPEFFTTPFMKDVTHLYVHGHSVQVPQPEEERRRKYYYLSTFNNQEWQPVAWAKANRGKILFENMGSKVIYLPCKYEDGEMVGIAPPFILQDDGTRRDLVPDTMHRQPMRIYRKYSNLENIKRYSRLFAGGRLEASNHPSFRNALVLHRFDDSIAVNYNTIAFDGKEKCRYVRFVGADGKFGGEVAEMELYDAQNRRLQGKVVGFDKGERKHPLEHAFDGNALTYYKPMEANGGWCGLDLGRPMSLSKIRILPHNDDNFIREGELYELNYWDGDWQSLGEQRGTSLQYLDYPAVPTNALYLLRNLSKGKEERIFTYEEGLQVWW